MPLWKSVQRLMCRHVLLRISLRRETKKFHRAISKAKVSKVEFYLQCGVNVNQFCWEWGDSALHCCAKSTGPETLLITKLLMAKGADPGQLNAEGDTPLESAVRYGCLEVMQYLLEVEQNHANVSHATLTALLQKALGDNNFIDFDLDKIVYLVNQGADPEAKDNQGNTALHYCARQKSSAVVVIMELLIAKGANMQQRNQAGDTPVECAASTGTLENMQYLLGKHTAISPALLTTLLQKTLNNEFDAFNLNRDYDEHSLDKIFFLLQQGVDLETSDSRGVTALHCAVDSAIFNLQKQLKVLNYLIVKMPDINILDNQGRTPLHCAVHSQARCYEEKVAKIVELLIIHGAAMDKVDHVGHTALDDALSANDFVFSPPARRIIELLLLKQPHTALPASVSNHPALLEHWQKYHAEAEKIRAAWGIDDSEELPFDKLVLEIIRGKDIRQMSVLLKDIRSEYPCYADFLLPRICEAFCNRFAYNKSRIITEAVFNQALPNKVLYPVLQSVHGHVINNDNNLLAYLVQQCAQDIMTQSKKSIPEYTVSCCMTSDMVNVSSKWQTIFATLPISQQYSNQ